MKKATNPQKKSAASTQTEHDTKQLSKLDRALRALLSCHELSREQLDRAAKASNSPDVVMRLRRAGFKISTHMQAFTLPDGSVGHYGVYRLEPESRIAAMLRLQLVVRGSDL